MSTPTRNCDECRHFAYYDGPHCAKDHRPRFYKPTIAVDVTAWGYKRKCADFEELSKKGIDMSSNHNMYGDGAESARKAYMQAAHGITGGQQ